MRKPLAIACALGLWLTVSPASALDFTWNSNGFDTDWVAFGGNWTLGGSPTLLVPDADDNVIFDSDLLPIGSLVHLFGSREVLSATFDGDAAFTVVGFPGNTLSLGTGNLTADLGDDPVAHSIAVGVILKASGTWDIGAATSGVPTLSIVGVIGESGGSFGFTKTGDGTLNLTASNAFAGGTVIRSGTVLANNASGSATGSGGVTVESLGTLGGTGSAAGTTTVSGGTVSPGASAGVLTLDDVLFENGSTLAIELAGDGGVAGVDFDQLLVNNTATLDPGNVLDLSYLGGFTAEAGDSFVILDAAAASLSGTFSTVNFPDAQAWFIDYDTPNGDVVVGIIPEPATLALLGLGLLLVGAGTGTRKRRPFNVQTSHAPSPGGDNPMRTPLAIACALGLCLIASPASALDFTWDSNGLDPVTWDFFGGNWALGGSPTVSIPDADDNVFFDSDVLPPGPPPLVELNGSREVLSATFDGDTAFFLSGDPNDSLSLGTGNLTADLGNDLSGHFIGLDVTLLASGTWDIDAAASGVPTLGIAGAIGESGGSFGFTKTGSGELELLGANTYTGQTVINAGIVSVFDALGLQNSTVVINVNDGLNLTNVPDPDVLLGGLSGTGNLNIVDKNLLVGSNNASTSYSGVISGTGGLTKRGTGELTLSGINTYSGDTIIEGGTVSISQDANLGDASADDLFMNSGLTDATLRVTDSHETNRDVDITALDATLSVDAGQNYTVHGTVSGGALNKTGDGVLNLTASNTYTGGTTIDGGTLALGNDNAAGTGTITVLGSTIDYADGIHVTNAIDLQNDATFNVDTGAPNHSGVIGETGGSFGITKTGAGALLLSGANTFSGGVTLAEGVLGLGSGSAAGTGNITVTGSGTRIDYADIAMFRNIDLQADTTLSTGALAAQQVGSIGETGGSFGITKGGTGTLFLRGNNTFSGGLTVEEGTVMLRDFDTAAGTGDITMQGGNILLVLLNVANNIDLQQDNTIITVDSSSDSTLSGVIGETGGSFGFRKEGGGKLTLTGDNTYTGDTIIDAGTLSVGNGGTTGSILGDVTNIGSLIFNRSDDLTFSGNITGPGDVTQDGGGKLTLAGTNTYTNGTFIDNGTISIGSDANLGNAVSDVTIANNAALEITGTQDTARDFALAGTATFRPAGGNTYQINGVISGSGQLAASTADLSGTGGSIGTLKLRGANTYTGGTVIDASTRVNIVNDANLGDAAGAVTMLGDAYLLIDATHTTQRDFALMGTLPNVISTLGGRIYTIDGVISGAGGFQKIGGGGLVLTNANTFTGMTSINSGTLQLAHSDALQNSTVEVIFTNGLDVTTLLVDPQVNLGGLAGSGDFDAGDKTLNVGSNHEDTTYTGVLSGAGATLRKQGDGILSLTNANTYTDGTEITSGTVLANNVSGSATGTGGVTVNTGGTFGGTGSAAGFTNVSGGSVSPGASAGVLTLDDVLFKSGSALIIELAGDGGVVGVDFDQLLINNAVTIDIGNTLDLSYLGGFIAEAGDSFVILDAAAASLSGTFETVNFPDAQAWFIDYDTVNGDVIVGVVPEPATLALMTLGGLALLRRRD